MTATEIPGPRGVPFLGNTHQWVRDPCAFHERCAGRYGSVVNYEIIGWDAYMLTDPAHIKTILEDRDRFPKHEASNTQLKKTLGDGLLTSEGPLWKRQREAIQPAFYMDQIREYAEIMVQRTTEMMAGWEDGAIIDVKREIRRCTLEIIVEAMFGEDIDLAARGMYDAVESMQAPLQPQNQPITFLVPEWAPIPYLRRAQRALDHFETQIYDILQQRRQSDTNREDLLSMLLAAETEMSDEQIRDEMLTFLFAGHETTALTLGYSLDLLTRNHNSEARLHEELDEVCDGAPTIEDCIAFEYTETIVKEALRLYPPAHEIRREPTDSVTIDGYDIPAGSLLVLPTWVFHRDEQFWDRPETFRPERWLESANRPAYAYFPFGGGPRRCIGQQFAMTEAQLVLATIAREWTFEREYDDLDLSAAVTLQPKGTMEMRPQRR